MKRRCGRDARAVSVRSFESRARRRRVWCIVCVGIEFIANSYIQYTPVCVGAHAIGPTQHDIALASTATVQRQRHAARAHSKNQSLLTTPGRARKPQAHRLDTSLRKPRATLCCSTRPRTPCASARDEQRAAQLTPRASTATHPGYATHPPPPRHAHPDTPRPRFAGEDQRAASPPVLRATSQVSITPSRGQSAPRS